MDIYAWNKDIERLLVIAWRKNGESQEVQPYVVNGDYMLQNTSSPNILQAPWDDRLVAHYVCRAPKGDNYTDVLNKVQKPYLFNEINYENIFKR